MPEPKTTAASQQASKPKSAPDPELALMARITRALGKLTPDAQKRIGRYLADRWSGERGSA